MCVCCNVARKLTAAERHCHWAVPWNAPSRMDVQSEESSSGPKQTTRIIHIFMWSYHFKETISYFFNTYKVRSAVSFCRKTHFALHSLSLSLSTHFALHSLSVCLPPPPPLVTLLRSGKIQTHKYANVRPRESFSHRG